MRFKFENALLSRELTVPVYTHSRSSKTLPTPFHNKQASVQLLGINQQQWRQQKAT
jgi:hypothetical protein